MCDHRHALGGNEFHTSLISHQLVKYCKKCQCKPMEEMTVNTPLLKLFTDFFNRVIYQSNQSFNIHPPGHPQGKPPHHSSHLNFWKIFVQISPPQVEKLFKCPWIAPFQVIKCPYPQENYQIYSFNFSVDQCSTRREVQREYFNLKYVYVYSIEASFVTYWIHQ